MNAAQSKSRSIRNILALICAFLVPVAIIYADVILLNSTMGESSLVQIAQVLMILAGALFFVAGARAQPAQRGYLVVFATLFLCMFIRENDGLLDHIAHGFWVVPASVTAFAGGLILRRSRDTVTGPFIAHAETGPFWILMTGFFQLMVFSRLFGSGHLWDFAEASAGSDVVKSLVQEGTELASYTLILLGSYLSLRSRFGAGAPEEKG